ncbi:xanthine dehydrogenase family protein subunit M [Roseomonas hellenica]|uniref:Xanthine dehydrogenase family protein subunit M n=1 Tax=Plastoroseomonas hellenica TaxID=2687306 RepID=A0ABS5EVP2_9PROT|nr:xanthine dehydrogenase family protein subunit M [Plastoroseomonas hellenica]MBR0664035.1 xanthine dehydrogenase family protein subunit M [Plastoroseomonas hellenica]
MQRFEYHRAADTAAAIALAARAPEPHYLGGGTNLVDLMRENIERPRTIIDVTALSSAIEARPDGGILIGAGAKNTAVAEHRAIRERFPMLARAILAGASAQIRNMATVGGNLLQRTRCYYFYDDAAHCNKRKPGTGCDAVEGFNRIHAILGASPSCVATHPSDMCVALAALDAIVHVEGPGGRRSLPFGAFHRLPGDRPDLETALGPAELITAVELPAGAAGLRSTYRKVRDRASYAFALVSVAAALRIEDGKLAEVRLALGGVAHKPWRAATAEAALRGKPAGADAFRAAAEAELAAARPLSGNAFKIELAKRTIAATLSELAGARP